MATFKFENKYVCAAYFNIALENFRITILDILSRIGIKRNDGAGDIPELLETLYGFLIGNTKDFSQSQKDQKRVLTLRNDQQVKLRQLLFRHFPILKPILASITHMAVQPQKEKLAELLSLEKKCDKEINRLIKQLKVKAQEEQQDIKREIKELKTKKSKVIDEYDEVLFSTFRDTDLQESLRILVKMAWVLNDLRNFYSHFSPYNTPESLKVQYVRQVEVAKWLSDIFAASRTIDKERNSITTEEMNFLNEAKKQGDDEKWREDPDYYFAIKGQNRLSESFLDPVSSVYQDYMDALYQKHKERRLASLKAQMDEALERDDEEEYGLYKMLFDRKDTPDKIAEIKEKIRPLTLSDFGVLYFCSTFLPRNYTLLMVDHAELMNNSPYSLTAEELEEKINACQTEEEKAKIDRTNTPRNNILREMLCIYRIRLPKGKRLDKKDTKGLLALDILNELRKCPEELYDLLSKDGKEFFIDRVNSNTGGAPDIVKRLRFGDRFAYLALRAIDECEVFNGIRFQIRLGSYRFKFYDKDCIDGSKQLRRWQKEINGYGRLQDIEVLRKQLWKDLLQKKEYDSVQLEDKSDNLDLMQFVEDTPDSSPYITDTRAQYNIHNNRIGLIWNGDECRLLKNINDNDIQRQGVFLPELVNADNSPKASGKEINQPSPLCSLSIFELPALLFYHYLYNTVDAQECRNEFDKPQQVIINKYRALRAFFNDVIQNPEQIIEDGIEHTLGKHGLKQSEIPKRIIELVKACQKEHKANNDADTYLPNILHLPMDEIRQLVRQKGLERYKDLPAKFLKKISEKEIIKSGLDSMLKPYGFSADTLPTKVLDMMLNPGNQEDAGQTAEENVTFSFNALFVRSVLFKISERLADVKNRRQTFMNAINRIGSKDNKFAKHGYMDIRHGKLAVYLAESLIKWQPTAQNGQDKLTGLNYDLLKSFLSTYGNSSDFDDLEKILQEALFIHKSNEEKSPIPHPFLDKVLQKTPRNIEELYYMYICEEEEHLQELLDDYKGSISTNTDNEDLATAITASDEVEKDKLYQPYKAEMELERPAFTHPERKRWKPTASAEALAETAKNYNHPIFLPDNLFVEPILKLIRKVYADNIRLMDELSKLNKKGEPACQSAAFIIDVYSRLVLKDYAQPYYCYDLAYPECSDFGRSYRLFNKLKNEKDQFKAYVPEPQDTITIMRRLKDKERMMEEIEQYIVTTERREKAEAEQSVRNKSIKEKWGFERIEEEMAKARQKATWPEQKKQEERAKLEGLARFVQKNERAIRRYRIQDIILFQMAKAMLASILGDSNNNQEHNFSNQSHQELKLENVCKENFLGQTINYEYEYQIGEHSVVIKQEGMSLKNYGQFYRLLSDVRLDTLLMLLADVQQVTLTEITSEFAKYDQERPIAFKKLHLLEQFAINAEGAESLENPDDDNFYFVNSKGEREPLRNNFANLLKRLQRLKENENNLLVAIRNAIGHNKYISDASQLTIDDMLEIPQVAEKMVKQIEVLQESISAIPEKQN